eukprot:2396109-Pleurochrysis_carterae.AAC.2
MAPHTTTYHILPAHRLVPMFYLMHSICWSTHISLSLFCLSTPLAYTGHGNLPKASASVYSMCIYTVSHDPKLQAAGLCTSIVDSCWEDSALRVR